VDERERFLLRRVHGRLPAVEAYYFGCWSDLGHYWHAVSPENAYTPAREIEARVPEAMRHGRIDGGFCPGHAKGDPYRRSRPEVEGEAKLSHVDGWTVLGWWDRSVDKRGSCNSNVAAKGTHDFTTMSEIAKRRVPHVMARQRQPLVLVEGP
jgi:hypothetical protein